MNAVGAAVDRKDGPAKLNGTANYAADFDMPKLAHAVLVQSTIASGHITAVNSEKARASHGVLFVMTYENAPKLPDGASQANPPGERALSLLQNNEVRYNGEPVAVVVAETLEQARHAASLIEISYSTQTAVLDFQAAKSSAYAPPGLTHGKSDVAWGDANSALAVAAVKVDRIYTTPMESHNPMEPHATLAVWNGDSLTVHDSTQGVGGAAKALAKKLGIAPEKVHVISPYVGGGFGSKGSAWSHVVLAAMAARKTGRPVRLALDRWQMFGPVGYRPRTEQHVALGADNDGKLVATVHEVITPTSTFEDWVESSAVLTRMLYACANVSTTHRLVKLHLGTPTFTRAPGEATGSFALESAMDELAHEMKIDPLELRLRNYAEKDPESGKPWSSKKLRECYTSAAEKFGWSRRNSKAGSTRDGNQLIGWGMATATYPANRMAAKATIAISPDGSALVQCGTQDIGTGTYTIIAQVACDVIGIPIARIKVEIGDSALPEAPVSGGSMSAASVTPAVRDAALHAREQLIALAIADEASSLKGRTAESLAIEDGVLFDKNEPTRRETIAVLLTRAGGKTIHAQGQAKQGDEKNKFAMHSFGAVFAEVAVDPDLGEVRVRRIVARYSVGKLLNAKTARSQFIGGIVWGIGMGLTEETIVDPKSGRVLNANLAQYHVPVAADIPDIDVDVVDEDDQNFNPLGARGIGEIGITGVPAAIANAVFNATGKRIRELPITPDKLLI
jgi:xanthine dehydrogenase YagR molybdenum-binding subunit